MTNKFQISRRMITKLFWENMLSFDDERDKEKRSLFDKMFALEALRTSADYNTSSMNYSASWCIYILVRYFGLKRGIEVGTFIGKSTVAILSGMDDGGHTGELFTCDLSNEIHIPWDGQSRLVQFPRTTSGDMLKQLNGIFDFVFLDGRLSPPEIQVIANLITETTIIALDDFEGLEKGVENFMLLSKIPQLHNHILIYPADHEMLKKHGFTSHSVTAVMLPASLISLARQG